MLFKSNKIIPTGYKEGQRTDAITEKEWIEKYKVGRMYTTFKAFEDPSLVANVEDTAIQIKKERLQAAKLYKDADYLCNTDIFAEAIERITN